MERKKKDKYLTLLQIKLRDYKRMRVSVYGRKCMVILMYFRVFYERER